MITESPLQRDTLSAIPLPSFRAYLKEHGYLFREQWGEYLDRFSKKAGGREYNILVPRVEELRDFDQRILEALTSLSDYEKTPLKRVVAAVANAGYEIIRFSVNEGTDQPTLAYDVMIDVLQGGYALVDSSAVVATTNHPPSYIQGRRPDYVRHYLDRIRVGQTEVGSFVLTMLLPTHSEDTLALPHKASEGFGYLVAQRLSSALKSSEEAARHGELNSVAHLQQRGVTANFSAALAQMIRSAGKLSIGVTHATDPTRSSRATKAIFAPQHADFFSNLAGHLKPLEGREPFEASGTIEEFREPSSKTSGTIVVRCEVHGEVRPVRMKFSRDQRSTVVEAIERKAEVLLTASGMLIVQGGHYKLEDVTSFRLKQRGSLA